MNHFNLNLIPRLVLWASLAGGISAGGGSLTGCSLQGKESRRDGNHNWEVSLGGNPSRPSDGSSSSAVPVGTEQVPEGGATSGGGYVYGYQSNPWFLGNVKTVRYCVDIDEGNFGPTRAQVEASIIRAIEMWKVAFANESIFPKLEVQPADILKLGTQDFQLAGCDESGIDLRFQLGKLSPEQRKILVNPGKFVASAVQTAYDEEQMRGRGFIYVGAEKGDLRPEADDLAEEFLRHHDQAVLDLILVHELGHVFGVPHQHNTNFPMGENVCELLVTNKFRAVLDFYDRASGDGRHAGFREMFRALMGDFFAVTSKRAEMSMSESGIRVQLGINLDQTKENSAVVVVEGNKVTIESWFEYESSDPVKYSKVRDLTRFTMKGTGTGFMDAVYMRVPKAQKIMTILRDDPDLPGTGTGSFISLPVLMTVQQTLAGELEVIDTGKKIPISIKTKPVWLDGGTLDMLEIIAVVDGKPVEIR